MKALLNTLHKSISERWMPEQVVQTILKHRESEYSAKELSLLKQALPRYTWSSMSSTFATADDMTKQLHRAEILFGEPAPSPHDVAAVRDYIDHLRAILGAEIGLDFKANRLTREQRDGVDTIPSGHRAYNKRFRLLGRMEEKFTAWRTVANMRDLAQIAKSRLATRVTRESLTDVESACYLAYMTARLNRRSVFTFGKQDRANDTVAELLLARLSAKADWFAISLVHPAPEIIAHLSDEQRGNLLGQWYGVMVRAAKVLKERAEADHPDLIRLVVARGNDSSTWNEAAGAFNRAREAWINLLYATGTEGLLTHHAPGKALRLMAADVVWGHAHYGSGGLEPDTAVWGALPRPWEVVLGDAQCTRAMIESACARFKIEGKGWIAPRPKTVVKLQPTPELVHGVVISSPALAQVLGRLGFFGGPSKVA